MRRAGFNGALPLARFRRKPYLRTMPTPAPDLAIPELSKEQRSSDGVRKFLLRMGDGADIEAVVIPSPRRTTLCMSTQVGCAMGCSFCATGLMGFHRNLTPDEIVGQYLFARRSLAADPLENEIGNLVYMGMGEPFLNFEAVTQSLRTLRDAFGFHSRIITVSTIGIPDRIVEFGRLFPTVRLAVSIHHPWDSERSALVPANRRWPLSDVLEAAREYQAITGKRLFFEYVLVPGVNDSELHARALGALLKDLDATVNLIPRHPGGLNDTSTPSREAMDRFWRALKASFGGHVTFRRSRGLDIDAACGQLAAGWVRT